MAVYGVGDVIAYSVFEWFKDQSNRKLVDGLLKRVTIEKEPKTNLSRSVLDGGKLAGESFVFTGTMPNLSRDEGKKMVRDSGGDVSESISSNIDYLVAGENTGSKYDKAKKLGVKIIDEEEFLKLIKE